MRGNAADLRLSLRLLVEPVEVATVDQMMESLAANVSETLESTVEQDEHGSRLLRPHIGFQPAEARYVVGDFGELGAITPVRGAPAGGLGRPSDGGHHPVHRPAGRVVPVLQRVRAHDAVRRRPARRRHQALLLDRGGAMSGERVAALVSRGRRDRGAASLLVVAAGADGRRHRRESSGRSAEVRESGERGLLPAEMRRAYGIDRLHDLGLRGQGQTVAIMSFDTFLDSDLEAWDRETGTVGGAGRAVVSSLGRSRWAPARARSTSTSR